MYVVVEIDKYGSMEIAVFDTQAEAEKLIEKLSGGLPHRYKVVVRSPIQLK